MPTATIAIAVSRLVRRCLCRMESWMHPAAELQATLADAITKPRSSRTAASRVRPAKRRLSRLEATAYHEAGHAVAAYLRKRRFTSISIIPSGGALGQCVFANNASVVLHGTLSRRVRDRIETLIIVSLAGVLAESMMTGRRNWRGAQADLHEAARYAGHVTSDDIELGAYISWLWERTRNLLGQRRHWAAVKALASELLVSGRVGERRARLLISKALEPRAAAGRRRAR